MQKFIQITGARENNLKNISLNIPRNQLVVLTGVSGSGKSSLAFDTLYAEGQKQYVESLSSYARMFLGQLNKPDVDTIDGLSPAIAIEQKTTSNNPRSTVGTVTEIYDYLRLLWARAGVPHCPNCGLEISRQSIDQIVDQINRLPEGTRYALLAPMIRDQKGEHHEVIQQAQKEGFARLRINGEIVSTYEPIQLSANKKNTIDIVIDRLEVRAGNQQRLVDSLEMAIKLSGDTVIIYDYGTKEEFIFSQSFGCAQCGFSLPELSPRMFSFNSQYGACVSCAGLGYHLKADPDKILPNRKLSLRQGAIVVKGWKNPEQGSSARIYYEALAEKYNFDLDTPLMEFSQSAVDALLYGTDIELLQSHQKKIKSVITTRKSFEGVIRNIERRYLETTSEAVKKELEEYMSPLICTSCNGNRLQPGILAVTIDSINIADFCNLSITQALTYMKDIKLSGARATIAKSVLTEIRERLLFLDNVGLGYLTLGRTATTLSGGESQRIRLATQIGSRLTGVLYILDEPSVGLHQRDNDQLLNVIQQMRDLGNTIIIVEHDEDIIRAADWIIDIGPQAGKHGGEIIAQGNLNCIINEPRSLTGQYLSGIRSIPFPKNRKTGNGKVLKIIGATENNLKDIDVSIPLGALTCVTGVSGSGKSSLVNEVLQKKLASILNGAHTKPGRHRSIDGIEYLDKVIHIDQSPIGRTPRSNPATYTGLFNDIRVLFAQTNEAKLRAYGPGRFSFNTKGGRCEACGGDGVMRIEMHFLPDVYVECDICKGKRYNRETLEVYYKSKSIADVLEMTAEEAFTFFQNLPRIRKKIEALCKTGLGYIKLGQPSTTLSGGEAQRVKLAAELLKPSTGSTLYIMDEPTTGLHTADVHQLINILQELTELGNTVVVIEHNLDVVKNADYIIDLGPEGGTGGGYIVCCGTPEQVADCETSHTGKYLKKYLNNSSSKASIGDKNDEFSE